MNDQSVLGLLSQQIGSADWSKWQIQRWQYFDFVAVPWAAATTASLSFFTNPLGSQDPNGAFVKTMEQTNLVKPSTFGQVYFIIQQIRCVLKPLVKCRQLSGPAAYTDFSFDQLIVTEKLTQAFGTGVLNLQIGQKAYFDLVQPWRNAPPGYGLGTHTVVVPFSRLANVSGNAFVEQSNNLSDVYALTPPQLIEPEQTFTCTIDFADLGLDFSSGYNNDGSTKAHCKVESGVIFDGYQARPVQ
jgi:hypothetical protein